MLGRARRIVAGILLLVLAWILMSQLGAGQQPLLGIVMLVAAAAAGIGLLLGLAWARPLGLALGIVVGIGALSLGLQGTSNPLASLAFSSADAARWYVVQPMGYGAAVGCAVIVLLLVLPFRSERNTA